METMALGLFALTFLLISVCCLHFKKPGWGIICSASAMALIYLTGSSWKKLLIVSGKDTALLGFHRYPAAPTMLAMLLLAALILIIVSIIAVARQNKRKV